MKQISYDVNRANRDRKTEVERLATQASLGWDKESRTLAWFGLEDGMTVLDAGCGPGFITKKLLDFRPNLAITAIDIDPSLIEDAQDYLEHAKPNSVSRMNFIPASVTDTQLPANSYDYAYARLLFQHLPNPGEAAREIYRVLKPGGKFVIYDIDDEMFGIISPPVPSWKKVSKMLAQAQAARGGNRYIGRQLWRILEAAGFRNIDLEIIAIHSDKLGLEAFYPQIALNRLQPYKYSGIITDENYEQLRKEREMFLESEAPYILMLALMVCGEKPVTQPVDE